MADDEYLERIDAHMDRGNELMREVRAELALSREQAARHAEQADRHAEQADRHAELYSDTREFIREMTLRIERGGREHVRELRRIGESVEANTRALLSQRDTFRDELRDLRDESRALVRAVLAVVDRMEGGGSAASG